MLKQGPQRQTFKTNWGHMLKAQIDKIKLSVNSNVKKVYFLKDRVLACIDANQNPFIFYPDKNRYIHIKEKAIQIVYIDKNEGHIAIALKSHKILICSINSGTTIKYLQSHQHSIINLHVNHQLALLLSVCQSKVTLWSLQNYTQIKVLHLKQIINSSFTPSAEQIIVVQDKLFSIYTVSTLQLLFNYNFTDPIHSCILGNQQTKTIISTNHQLYFVSDNETVRQIPVQCQQFKVSINGNIFIISKNHQIFSIDQYGDIKGEIQLDQGQTPIHMDISQDQIAIVINSGEIIIYNTNKLKLPQKMPDLSFTSTMIQRDSHYQNKPFQVSQSTVLKRKPDDCSFSTLNKMVKGQDPLKSIMTQTKLKSCLKTFGAYPANQRTLAWRSLLNLPMNEEAYKNLCNSGVHPAYKNLRERYPLESDSLYSRLQRTLSCLAHYYPFLAEIDYLPEIVFPFVKLFSRGEELVLFEFCQHYFTNYPQPPLQLMSLHGYLFELLNPDATEQNEQQAWRNLRCLFTNILNQDRWLKLMDFLITNHENPLYLLVFSAYYNKNRDFDKVLDEIPQLDIEYASLPLGFSNNLPLLKDQYQILNIYPQTIYSREEILREEMNLMGERQRKMEIDRLRREFLEQQEEIERRQEELKRKEKEKMEMLQYELEMKAQKKLVMNQERRERQLQQLNEEQLGEQNVLEEIQWGNYQNIERQNRAEEEAYKQLEYEGYQKLNDAIELKIQQQSQRRQRQELEFQEKFEQMEKYIQEEHRKLEQELQQY